MTHYFTFFEKSIGNFYIRKSIATPPREIAWFSQIFLLRSRLFKDRCIGLQFRRVISGCEESPPLLPLIKITHQMHVAMPNALTESTPRNLSDICETTIVCFVRRENAAALLWMRIITRAMPDIILRVHKFPAEFLYTQLFISQ